MLASGCAAKRLEWDEVCSYDPDKLFVDLCSSDLARNLREAPWLESQEGWRNLAAVKSGEVYLIDHSYFSRPGPRVIEGIEILAQLTHPELFTGLVPRGAVLKLDAQRYAGLPAKGLVECFFPYN